MKPPPYPVAIGTPEQLALIEFLVGDETPATRGFMVYLLLRAVGRIRRLLSDPGDYELEWVRLHSQRVIRRHFRGADWRRLRDEWLIDTKRYDADAGLSRGFKVDERVLERFVEAGRVRVVGAEPPRWVDLYTGKRTTRQVRSERNTRSGNALPPLVRGAIDAVGPALFNAAAVESHLDAMAEAARRTRGADRQKAQLRHMNDETCYGALFLQRVGRPADVAPHLPAKVVAGLPADTWAYVPAYRMQSTGRLGQIGGGLQSATREMKEAAYSGIPDLRNYDLKSSQARIMITLMEEAGVDPAWLIRYTETPQSKRVAAAAVGVDVDTWKRVLYAMLMGARVFEPSQFGYAHKSKIVKALRGTAREAADGHDPKRLYDNLYGYTRGLTRALETWHDHLVGPYLEAHGRRNNVDGRLYVPNRVGAVLAVEGPGIEMKTHKRKAKLAAHLLQGREAAFTHTVAVEAVGAGIPVLSHEHDGLVTIGEVPDTIVAEAAKRAGLPQSRVGFVLKPFV